MGLLSISSFLLAVEWWLPWKLIQTRAKSLYNPISINSPSPPHLTLASVGSSFLSYVGKSCDWWGTRKEVLHNLSQPLDTKSEPAVATDSVDTLVREWRSERSLPYLHWRSPPAFPSKCRMCRCCSSVQCSSAQQLYGVSQSTEQLCYPAKTLLPEKRKPIPSISMVVWRKKMRFGTQAMTCSASRTSKWVYSLSLGSFRYRWLSQS